MMDRIKEKISGSLEGIIKGAKRGAGIVLLGAGLAVASPNMARAAEADQTNLSRRVENNYALTDHSIYPAIGTELYVDVIQHKFDFSEGVITQPIHPDDGGPARGAAVIDFNELWDLSLRAGLNLSIGTEYFRLKAGAYARLNPFTMSKGGYRSGNYEVELFDLPSPYESYAYSKIWQAPVTYGTYYGVDVMLNGFFVSGEIGQPYADFTVERGWDRYAKFEEDETYHFRGTGNSWQICAGAGDSDITLSLCGRQETFELEDRGEKANIESTMGSVNFTINWR